MSEAGGKKQLRTWEDCETREDWLQFLQESRQEELAGLRAMHRSMLENTRHLAEVAVVAADMVKEVAAVFSHPAQTQQDAEVSRLPVPGRKTRWLARLFRRS